MCIRDRSTINYFKRMNGRFAGYHTIVDPGRIYHLANPAEWRMFHSRNGGNDGIGLSMATHAKHFRAKSLGLKGLGFLATAAQAVLEIEDLLGICVDRIHPDKWDQNAAGGFYSHADVDPTHRSDPGWGPEEYDLFFQALRDAEVAPGPVATQIGQPAEPLADEFEAAIAAGITNGHRPHDIATRREVAVMAYRASRL